MCHDIPRDISSQNVPEYMVRYLGTYTQGGNTGGESSGGFAHQTLNYADGMDLPVVVGQINRGVKDFVPHVKTAMQHGVSVIGFWRDTKGDTTRGEGPMSWWHTFPSIVRTLQKELDPRFAKFKGEMIDHRRTRH